MSTLLGFIDSKIKDEFTGQPWKTSKIGGSLSLSSSIKDQELNDLKRFMFCEKCTEKMIFIGQICCPLEIDNYDRYLIIFACNKKDCGQWSVIRYLENPKESFDKIENESAKNQVFEEEDNWFNDQDNWNDVPNEIKEDKLKKEIDNCPNQENNQFIVMNENVNEFIQPYYLDVELEDQTEDHIKLDNHVQELLKNYKLKEKNEKGESSKDTNEYSKMDETDILENYNNDILTYKFYKKLSLASGQVIRYAWNQKPLLNSSNVKLEPFTCDKCGSEKVFEFQLMPALINRLKFKNNQSLNLEFATILVFTCKQNCSNKMLTKESCVVLEENDGNIPEDLLKN